MTLPTKAALVAFIATRERAAAKAFYQDVLGLRLVADDPFALVFDSHGVTVRITEIRGHAPSAHTVLGWTVPDMASAVSGLVAKGVRMITYPGFEQDPQGVWTAPGGGARVCWFADPDGNVLSLTSLS